MRGVVPASADRPVRSADVSTGTVAAGLPPAVCPADKVSFTYLTQPISQADLAVLTDGLQDKTDIGAAFIFLDKSGEIVETKQYKLPEYRNNFEAAGIAILKAIEHLQTSFKEANVQLYTDSLPTLKAINNPNSRNPKLLRKKE